MSTNPERKLLRLSRKELKDLIHKEVESVVSPVNFWNHLKECKDCQAKAQEIIGTPKAQLLYKKRWENKKEYPLECVTCGFPVKEEEESCVVCGGKKARER